MSENKHTPGPWRVVSNTKLGWCGVLTQEGDVVADVSIDAKDFRATRHALADACLIAAAPDMLEALEAHPDPRDFDGDMGLYLFAFETWRVKRDAAIKKARGAE